MNCKRSVTILVITMLLANYCMSQRVLNVPMTPKIKAKINSWYPNATNIQVEYDTSKHPAEIVDLLCHCSESAYNIEITFDTNANVLNKNYFYLPIKELPDTIQTLVTMDTSYTPSYFRENINKKGVVTYLVYMSHHPDKGTCWEYFWNFKSTGELLSKEKHCVYGIL
jgi:hypothetical protein